MGLFSKDKESQNYRKEKNALYCGTTLQPIGIIPKGEEVEIRLNPKKRLLIIEYEGEENVTLPYERIRGFVIDYVTEEKINQNPNLAALVLSTGLFGTAGKVASVFMGNKKKVVWIGTLRYVDKAGREKELTFSGDEERIGVDEKPYKDECDREFEMIVNRIANSGKTDLYEL